MSDVRDGPSLTVDGPVPTPPRTKVALRIGLLLQSECPAAIEAALSAAAAIAQSDPRFEVVAAAVNGRIAEHARQDHHLLGTWVELVELSPVTMTGRLLYGARQVYADNLDFFASLDIIITAGGNASILRSHFGLKDLAIVSVDPAEMPPERIERLLPHFFATLRAGGGTAQH